MDAIENETHFSIDWEFYSDNNNNNNYNNNNNLYIERITYLAQRPVFHTVL